MSQCLCTCLIKVEDSWKATEFPVLAHKDSKDVFILGGTDDIQQLLDDSNINIATIASSRHVGPIKQKVDDWQRSLELFGKTLVCKYSLLGGRGHIILVSVDKECRLF